MAVEHEQWLTGLLMDTPTEQLSDMESRLKNIITSLRDKLENGD